MRSATHAHAAFALEALDHVGELAMLDRYRRLRLERLEQLGPLEALVARAEEGDDFSAEVAAQLALVRRLAAEEVEVDQARQRVGLQVVRGVSACLLKEGGQ